jgi:hypothetical protein
MQIHRLRITRGSAETLGSILFTNRWIVDVIAPYIKSTLDDYVEVDSPNFFSHLLSLKLTVSPFCAIRGRSPQKNTIYCKWYQNPKIEHIWHYTHWLEGCDMGDISKPQIG